LGLVEHLSSSGGFHFKLRKQNQSGKPFVVRRLKRRKKEGDCKNCPDQLDREKPCLYGGCAAKKPRRQVLEGVYSKLKKIAGGIGGGRSKSTGETGIGSGFPERIGKSKYSPVRISRGRQTRLKESRVQ